jgi:hypothetical protein
MYFILMFICHDQFLRKKSGSLQYKTTAMYFQRPAGAQQLLPGGRSIL